MSDELKKAMYEKSIPVDGIIITLIMSFIPIMNIGYIIYQGILVFAKKDSNIIREFKEWWIQGT